MHATVHKAPVGRIVSIDALRGFDMFWIIGGGTIFLRFFQLFDNSVSRALTTQLHHAAWDGFRFEDLIFPLFLFIIGASMPFSLTKRLDRGDSRKDLYVHIIKRTVTLYVLGLIYYGLLDFNFSEQRYAGVLPRLAFCYFFASLIVMNTGVKGQTIALVLILVVYWAAMMLIPVPGSGAGVLTPEGNLATWVDVNFLPGKFNHYGDCTIADSTGLLPSVPAIGSTLLGVLSGHWLRSGYSHMQKVRGLAAAGVVSIVVAYLWGLVFPINKLLWTSSYVMLAGGWSFFLLALFYWVIDVCGYRTWAFPFIVIGMNPITIYFVQRMFDFGLIATIFVHGFIDSMGVYKPLFWALSVFAVKWLFLYFLYRRKIFLKA